MFLAPPTTPIPLTGSDRYPLLFWITVLNYEIAGETGKVVVVHNLNRTFTSGDWFAGAGKVMLRRVS